MDLFLYYISFILYASIEAFQSPPGVNPNQYQQQQQYQPPPQQPPPQYQQPPQQQYQQPPQQQQYQQPPQQQYQQPPQQQYQQQPPQQNAHHQPARAQQRVLNANNVKQERDHIKDHLEVPMDTSGMSEQELQYHYFKMHDADGNNQLDGQELIKSLFHWHDASNHDSAKPNVPEHKIFTDEELVQMIDPILEQDDKNKDGFIDYPEFVQAQRNSAANAP